MITRIGIKGYRVLRYEQNCVWVTPIERSRPPCPGCRSRRWVRSKGRYERKVRHLEVFGKESLLRVECRRFKCLPCKRTFIPALPGILAGRHSSEPFREKLALQHHEGISKSGLAKMARIGGATIERIYHQFTRRKAAERESLQCPTVLGIDGKRYTEHLYRQGNKTGIMPGWKNRRLEASY